ncbi:snRNA-activating protein of 50kDa MW C terminal family protein [Babesia bovis T2Bo]|uniref:snRNA-activating protein complex subunit 3 n=1 Tax=Babesia bovis TaxID=5865 RepID=A7APY7_BABBO|nr:snRNA-activating protein of 50kDa MW C terminal family protein [Babesia bovis T2Bo]EDO08621.1 snRNA-activating protein of 50kDa MW C terminal family protein [Babesia bovis T2Bo]|eukprot:XP_001612189.1 hypothetical protein [Babesia bovis T2Bo]
MLGTMPRIPSGVPFKRIPHVSVSELLEPEDIIIVDGYDSNERSKGKQRHNDAVDCPSNKYRRTTGGSTSLPAGKSTRPELNQPSILSSKLKDALPVSDVDLFEYRDKYRRMMSRLDTLRETVMDANISKIQSELGISSYDDAKVLYMLRTDSKLLSYLSQPIRTPTITEVISSATTLNVDRLLSSQHRDRRASNKRLDIAVDETTHPWSEKNLYRFFAQKVNLESYKLAVGERRYIYENSKRDEELSRLLTLSGPQNSSSPALYHQHATQNFFDKHNVSASTLVADDELVITVSLYHGVRGHKIREFDMLSSQTLAELRDAFRCASEIRPLNVDLKANGSCFMLNGQLFPDLRNDACDYSEPLLHFLYNYKPGILRTSECIEQTDAVLSHLELPIYMPGFLLHHGDCEHRLMITAIRIFDRTRDCPYEECYPLKVFMPRQRAKQCNVCEYNEPSTTVFNSLVLPHIPSHLCNYCYTRLKLLESSGGVYRSDGLASSVAIEYCGE